MHRHSAGLTENGVTPQGVLGVFVLRPLDKPVAVQYSIGGDTLHH